MRAPWQNVASDTWALQDSLFRKLSRATAGSSKSGGTAGRRVGGNRICGSPVFHRESPTKIKGVGVAGTFPSIAKVKSRTANVNLRHPWYRTALKSALIEPRTVPPAEPNGTPEASQMQRLSKESGYSESPPMKVIGYRGCGRPNPLDQR
jgi:hypothetical protein